MLSGKISTTFSNPIVLQQCRFLSNKMLYPKKFKSILSVAPSRPRSGWQVYMRDHLSEFKSPDGKTRTATATQRLSEQWKGLNDSQKQSYIEKYQKEAKLHDDAVKKALTDATPQQIHDENILRRKYNMTLLKDPKQPKRPLNSYMIYLNHLRKTGSAEFKQLSASQQAHEGSKSFKLLSAHEKETYEQQAKKNHADFLVANDEYKSQIV
ncbi:hypothetical protein BCR42DRAFT_397778 [Absidia repens]|uniref:HMG box domain-containing protein n=1 Tax=Absidia repens TaxID=90262 RepID=A0A1X2I0G7_9FUNG|nr:hypothetical protein BCR42DRAFT_397778 [Absidia repens]